VDKITIGVDLGGTKIKAALVGGDGRILYSMRRMTNAAKGSDWVISTVVEAVQECLQRGKGTAVGLGVAGQIDPQSGDVVFAPNLGWRDLPLRDELHRRLGLPVRVINDVRAATVGEWTYGAAPQTEDMVCLFVGTGIGGGAVIRGHILEGCNNSAAELGHMTIVADGRRCRCPNLGCLEAYAGGWAIAERTQAAIRQDPGRGRRILEIAGSLKGVTAKSVSAAFSEGDALARQIVEETAKYLAAGIVAVIHALNPCVVILGGGVIGGIPALISLSESQIRRRALSSATDRLKILRSALDANAGCIGAAVLARDIVLDEAR
jgi:glucokinase